MATQLEQMDDLLGVPATLAGSPMGLANSVEDGLSISALERLAKTVAPKDRGFIYRIVPKATLERRRKRHSRLTNAEGNRVARLAKVYSMAQSIYRDDAKVHEFLTRPHVMLENQSPLDAALATGPGADAVINLLGRAAYSGGA